MAGLIVLSSAVSEQSLVEALENDEQSSQKFRKVIRYNRSDYFDEVSEK